MPGNEAKNNLCFILRNCMITDHIYGTSIQISFEQTYSFIHPLDLKDLL
jgi:hypothetical protein